MEFMPDELYEIIVSYIYDINDIINLSNVYPDREKLTKKDLNFLTSDNIVHVKFREFVNSNKLIHCSNNILFDLNDKEDIKYFYRFGNIVNINFYIDDDKLSKEIDTYDYFAEFLQHLPFTNFINKTIRILFRIDKNIDTYYGYIFDNDCFMIANINQLRYIVKETLENEKSYWNSLITEELKFVFPNKIYYETAYSSVEVASYKNKQPFHINLLTGKSIIPFSLDNMFIYTKVDSSEEIYHVNNILKDFMLNAKFGFIDNKILNRLIYVNEDIIYNLIKMYSLNNNLFRGNNFIIDDFLKDHFHIEPFLNKQNFIQFNTVVSIIKNSLTPVDKISFNRLISLKLPPSATYIEDYLSKKDYTYTTLIVKKIEI